MKLSDLLGQLLQHWLPAGNAAAQLPHAPPLSNQTTLLCDDVAASNPEHAPKILIRASRRFNHAVVITEDGIQRIVATLLRHFPHGSFRLIVAYCDGLVIESSSVGEWIEFDARNENGISALKIRAQGRHHERCTLYFEGRRLPISEILVTSQDESQAKVIGLDLESLITGFKPSYWWLISVPPFVPFSILSTLFLAAVGWVHRHEFPATHLGDTNMLWLACASALLAGILIAADRGWRWMLPKLWFSIGRRKQQLEVRGKVCYALLVSFVCLGILKAATAYLISAAS